MGEKMSDWQPMSDDPPFGTEVMLWLRAEDGEEKPIGPVIGTYKNTEMGEMWVEKSISGLINTGIRKSLITHWKHIGEGPDDDGPGTDSAQETV